MNIFVGSLPFRLQEAELSKEFERFGEASSVKIITDKMTGSSKGFGFVEMPNDEQAQAAISALNGSQVGGRDIVVNQAQERKEGGGGERRSFGGGNRGGGYGGGNRGGNNDRW
ncbi:MAG: RNA-binding protein [Bacteroidetes bacterium]|nr:RNA-binding protein [Bacteroidota bacterium]